MLAEVYDGGSRRDAARISEEGVERLLTMTFEAGRSSGIVDDDSLSRVSIDTTVTEKNIAYPTDARLFETRSPHQKSVT